MKVWLFVMAFVIIGAIVYAYYMNFSLETTEKVDAIDVFLIERYSTLYKLHNIHCKKIYNLQARVDSLEKVANFSEPQRKRILSRQWIEKR